MVGQPQHKHCDATEMSNSAFFVFQLFLIVESKRSVHVVPRCSESLLLESLFDFTTQNKFQPSLYSFAYLSPCTLLFGPLCVLCGSMVFGG